MLAKIESYALQGIDGFPVTVEVDISNGLPVFETVGLPDAAVKESRERVRSALKNSGFSFPISRITVNLAPADVKKEGPLYDLPMAVGILISSGQCVPNAWSEGAVLIGELSLDGGVREVRGILPMLIAARNRGVERFIIPKGNMKEAESIGGVEVYGAETLAQAVSCVAEGMEPAAEKVIYQPWQEQEAEAFANDFADIKGQESAKRAMEIAAAGGHNVILVGPPGSGKTMLARALPGILPKMTFEEALEVTKIHSIVGTLPDKGIMRARPFRTPHHTASLAAVTGGGTKSHPGEVSLAHYGVLFLDELPEFPRMVLEALRQPVEDGVISVVRVKQSVTYPAQFMLVAGMNPCPCGHYGDPNHECRCTPIQISKYLSKISGPLLDRIDLQVFVEPVTYTQIAGREKAEPSHIVRERVERARALQAERFKGREIFANCEMNSQLIQEFCHVSGEGEKLLRTAFTSMRMSARGYTRVLKVARTIADLDDSREIGLKHVAEAIQYRNLDRQLW